MNFNYIPGQVFQTTIYLINMIMFVRIYVRKSQEKSFCMKKCGNKNFGKKGSNFLKSWEIKFQISGTFFVLNNIEKIKSQKLES